MTRPLAAVQRVTAPSHRAVLRAVADLLARPVAEDPLRLVLRDVLVHADANAIAVIALDPTLGRFHLLAHLGMHAQTLEQWREFDAALPTPARDAVTTRSTVLLESPQARDEAYPVFRGSAPAQQFYAVVPMLTEPAAYGVLTLGWSHARHLAADDVALLEAIAALCGEALGQDRTAR